MIQTPQTTTQTETVYRLTPHEQVRILRRTPELLEAEATYSAGGKAPLRHRHPAQLERFTVIEGQLEITVDGTTQVLSAGETATVGPGQAHAMAATAGTDARVTWQTSPPLSTEAWWAGMHALGDTYDGDPPLPAIARLLKDHHDVFQLALPRPLDRLAVLLLARLPLRRR